MDDAWESQLDWVSDKVLSKRARVDRQATEALKQAHDLVLIPLEESTAELDLRAERIAAVEAERGDAQAELAKLRRTLEVVLGKRTFRASPERGEAA